MNLQLITDFNQKELKQQFLKNLEDGYHRLLAFIKNHNLPSITIENVVHTVYLFRSHFSFKQQLSKDFGVKESMIDKKVVAVMNDATLYVVDEGFYYKQYPSVDKINGYSKLLTHELGHQYHSFLLHKEESKMGPEWFYEGLAMIMASQYEMTNLSFTNEELSKVLFNEQYHEYTSYSKVVFALLNHFSITQMIEKASELTFNDEVYEILQIETM